MQEQILRKNIYNADKKSKIDDALPEPCKSPAELLANVKKAIDNYHALPWYRLKYPSHRRIANKISQILLKKMPAVDKSTTIHSVLQDGKIKEGGIFGKRSKQSFLYALSTYVSQYQKLLENKRATKKPLANKNDEFTKPLEETITVSEHSRDMERLRAQYSLEIKGKDLSLKELTSEKEKLMQQKLNLEGENNTLMVKNQNLEKSREINSAMITMLNKERESNTETLRFFGNLWWELLPTVKMKKKNVQIELNETQMKNLNKTLEHVAPQNPPEEQTSSKTKTTTAGMMTMAVKLWSLRTNKPVLEPTNSTTNNTSLTK
jgi:hypothetical protein